MPRAISLLPLLAITIPLAGCGGGPDPAALAATITADDLARITRTVSADEFGGRGPDSEGERVTLDYLTGEFERIGLEPMGDGDGESRSYLQRVPVARITADPESASLRVPTNRAAARRGELAALRYGDDFVAWTRHEEPTIDVTAPLVFVGYGVVAPEEDWNDFPTDLAGSILVMLVNDPPVPGKFGDAAMTYYGRWTYKFEEAARQGAVGALIIHDTEAAGYGWSVVRSSWSGAQFHLPVPSDQPAPALFEGWISQRAAAEIFAASGRNLAEAVAAAAAPGFAPIELGLAGSVHLDNELGQIVSHNVIGGLAGRDAPEETVAWTAHWDHLGEDPSLDGDTIYNGALDNATGVAALLEIAEAFAGAPERTRRSQLFVATALEEKGLLGSTYYASHPVVSPAHTVGAINIDGLNVWGPTSDVTVIGQGNSELDEILATVLEEQGRTITPDPEPEKGFFYRSDHFPLAKVGIPSLYIDAGVSYRERPSDYGSLVRDQYTQLHYHQPSDEFDPAWNWEGAELDVRTLFRVGFLLGEGDEWPEWSENSEFRAAREASRTTER